MPSWTAVTASPKAAAVPVWVAWAKASLKIEYATLTLVPKVKGRTPSAFSVESS